MHAYLLIANSPDRIGQEIEKLAKKISGKIMEFPLLKIEDVRNLNSLIRLSFEVPTLIVCKNIHQAGEEALNAFLKNLEEPQENIYFVLTAPSTKKVLPTIVSRCQIIRIKNDAKEFKEDSYIERFFKMDLGKRLSCVDKIKNREEAIEFAENLVFFMHRSLHENKVKYGISIKNVELALKTLSGLKANGNVNLQLSNFVINYQ